MAGSGLGTTVSARRERGFPSGFCGSPSYYDTKLIAVRTCVQRVCDRDAEATLEIQECEIVSGCILVVLFCGLDFEARGAFCCLWLECVSLFSVQRCVRCSFACAGCEDWVVDVRDL